MKHKDFVFSSDIIQGRTSGEQLRVGIVVATFNGDISNGLLKGCKKGLKFCSVQTENIYIYSVDGCVEIPIIAQRLAKKKLVDVIICLGSVIKGDTPHFDYVCQAVTDGITSVSLDNQLPVIFGVLTTLNYDQAVFRSSDNDNNKGFDCALTAVKTTTLLQLI
jgi:6,7-dimethyl-8-ribityllumazine synthase